MHTHLGIKCANRPNALNLSSVMPFFDHVTQVITDNLYYSSAFTEFCHKLCGQVKKLHLWAARIFHNDIPPYITEFALSVPLRSPAAVSREVNSLSFSNYSCKFSSRQ